MGEKGKAKVRPRWERVHAEQDPRRVETRPSFPSIQTLPLVHFIPTIQTVKGSHALRCSQATRSSQLGACSDANTRLPGRQWEAALFPRAKGPIRHLPIGKVGEWVGIAGKHSAMVVVGGSLCWLVDARGDGCALLSLHLSLLCACVRSPWDRE